MDGWRRLVSSLHPRHSERREICHFSIKSSSGYERSIFKSIVKFATVDHCFFVITGKLKVEIKGFSGENVLHDGETVVISADPGFKLDFASPSVELSSVANGRGIETLIQDTGKPFEGFSLPDKAEKLEKVDSEKLARVAKGLVLIGRM